MNSVWRTVRVFISSTFRDMQAERDWLVRFVFPRLREHLLPHRIHLLDIDLRWGVTSEQDAENICREVIDECRPRFVCVLGGRYGWVPQGKPRSITADEVYYAVLDRPREAGGFAYFYFRDEVATAAMEEATPGEFREAPGSEKEALLTTLKQTIVETGLKPFTYPARWDPESGRLTDLKAFGDRVYADLLGSINSDPELRDRFQAGSAPPLDEFAEERQATEAFAEERAEGFVLGSRAPVYDELLAYTAAGSRGACVWLSGPSGSGKSSLLAYLSRQLAVRFQPPVRVISHFVGASPSSSDVRRALRRMCHELKAVCPDVTDNIPEDLEELPAAFRRFLELACTRERVVVLLDGFDQFDPLWHAAGGRWLPVELPANACLIVSGAEGPAMERLCHRLREPRRVELKPFSAEDCRAVIGRFRRRYRKALEEKQCAALLAKDDAGLPLYLVAALEELRTLGTYEEISGRIAELPPTVGDLFAWVLRRLASDDGFRDVAGIRTGAGLVSRFAALLSTSRYGLSQSELTELIPSGDAGADPSAGAGPAGNVAALLRLLRPYLVRRGELLDFYHNRFRSAAASLWLASDTQRKAAHRQLAEYFDARADPGGGRAWAGESRRAFSELPFHLSHAGMRDELVQVMTSLQFIRSKFRHGGLQEFLADCESCRQQEGDAFNEESLVAEFEKFISEEAHFLTEFPDLLYQQAFNSPSRDRVRAAAGHLVHRHSPREGWLRRTKGAGRQSHSGEILSMAFLQGDRLIAVSSSEREVWAWDVVRGELRRRFESPPSAAKSLAASPDGGFLAAGFGGPVPSPFISGVLVWDCAGSVHRKFDLTDWVYAVRWQDDARLIAAGGMPAGAEAGGSAWELDLVTGERSGRSFGERPVMLTWQPWAGRDGLLLALANDGTVRPVDPGRAAVAEPTGKLDGMRSSPDGRYQSAVHIGGNVVCILGDGCIRIHDFDNGQSLQIPVRDLTSVGGTHPVCLAGSGTAGCVVVGTSCGQAWLLTLGSEASATRIHCGDSAVTSVCVSASGRHVAVGDHSGQVYVYRRPDGSLLFQTGRTGRYPLAVRLAGPTALLLHGDELAIRASDGEAAAASIPLDPGLHAVDFDAYGDIAVALSYAREPGRGPAAFLQIIDLAARRVVAVGVPSCPPELSAVGTLTGQPAAFRRLRLHAFEGKCSVALASARGVAVYPLLAFSSGRALTLPESVANRPGIVTRLDLLDEPSIACQLIEPVPNAGTLLCSYSDNVRYDSIGGEARSWDASTCECSSPQAFSGLILSLSARDGQSVVVGTSDGEASTWRFGQEWHWLSEVRHPAAVVATACGGADGLVGSASRDGSLAIWDPARGVVLFRTFVRVEPRALGFQNGGRRVVLVDTNGESYVWEIVLGAEGGVGGSADEALGASDDRSNPGRGVARAYVAAAEVLGAVDVAISRGEFDFAEKLLAALPPVPDAADVRRCGSSRLVGARLASVLREAKLLAEAGKFDEAERMLLGLPDEPTGLSAAKQWYLDQIREAREQAKHFDDIRKSLDCAKLLAEAGKFDEAERMLLGLPDQPQELASVNKDFLRQLDEARRRFGLLLKENGAESPGESLWSKLKRWLT